TTMKNRSLEVVQDLLASHEEGEIITRETDPRKAADEIHQAFGKYYTDALAEYVKKADKEALESDLDFKKDPARITFFVVHEGEGFQLSKPKHIMYDKLITNEEGSFSSAQIIIDLSPDDYEWIGRELGLPYVNVVRQGLNYKINEIVK